MSIQVVDPVAKTVEQVSVATQARVISSRCASAWQCPRAARHAASAARPEALVADRAALVVGRMILVASRGLVAAIGLACASLMALAPAAAAPPLDSNADFRLLASNGFAQAIDGPHAQGSELNQYAWAMAWFKGKLYVGTGRFSTDGSAASLATMTGQIWAYTPGGSDGATGTWALAYESPPGIAAPREFGYRWMTVCRFGGREYLYVSTAGVFQGNILRTADGVTFTPMSRTGYPPNSVGFRTMACFTEPSGKQLLITTEVGKAGDVDTYDSDLSDSPIVLANDDPTGAGSWRNYSPMRMGDPVNNAIFTLYAHDGVLYAGVGNQVEGGQLWRTTGCATYNPRSPCIPAWTRIIDRGAGRVGRDANGQAKNQGVSDMMAFGDGIYVGVSTGTSPKPPAEMWKLRSDGTIEIVVGEPRLNFGPTRGASSMNSAYPANLRCGVPLEDIDGIGGANDCPPSSRRGAGFGPVSDAAGGYPSGGASYFWRLLAYGYDPSSAPLGDGRLYTGTLQNRREGGARGFDVLATPDGVTWTTLVEDGLGNPDNLGMRTIAATPFGLFIGTANRSTTPGSAGCSVWVGIPGADGSAPASQLLTPPSPAENALLATRNATFAWTASDGADGSLPLTYATRLTPVESTFGAFGPATARSVANLGNGSYVFEVLAKDSAGNVEATGGVGAANRRAFVVDAPDAAPSVSINVAPAGTSSSPNASFAWTGSDDLTPVSALVYKRWLTPLEAEPAGFASGTGASYANLGDGAYTFHVVARDATGHTSGEATASFTVAIGAAPPAAPASVTVARIGTSAIRVTWTDVAGETGYNVERCAKGRSCLPARVATELPAGTATFDDILAAGAPAGPYSYLVQACNVSGCSRWTGSPRIAAP